MERPASHLCDHDPESLDGCEQNAAHESVLTRGFGAGWREGSELGRCEVRPSAEPLPPWFQFDKRRIVARLYLII